MEWGGKRNGGVGRYATDGTVRALCCQSRVDAGSEGFNRLDSTFMKKS